MDMLLYFVIFVLVVAPVSIIAIKDIREDDKIYSIHNKQIIIDEMHRNIRRLERELGVDPMPFMTETSDSRDCILISEYGQEHIVWASLIPSGVNNEVRR